MPPKSGSGKKKLSKAEKERLKKEEADRKLQEEEDAKRQAEQEEKERKQREKFEAQERMKVENEERRIRKGEMQELMDSWYNHMNILDAEHAQRRTDAKWERYMKCDGSPDPTIPGEIHTYLNLWTENKVNNDIDSVLKAGKLTLSLIAELKFLLSDTPAKELSEEIKSRYNETISDLQQLLQEKLDLATYDLLLKATDKRDSETSNLQEVVSDDKVTLCLWGNLSKNPRIKSYEFADQGITFDIPRPLRLTDCAYRILFTKYDHFSPKSQSFFPRIKKKIEEVPVEVEPQEEEKPAEEEEKKEGEEEEDGIDRETTEDLMASLRKANKPDEEEPKEEEPKEEEEAVVEMEEDYDVKTPEPEEFEDFDGDEDDVDLRGHHVLGGIFHFDLLQLPPQPKVAKQWIITEVIEPPELVHMPYIADPVTPAASAGKENEKKENKEEAPKKEEKPPIGIELTLPKDVYFCEEPQVAWWDRQSKTWKLDGFTDNKFNEETRVLSFKTNKFGTFSLLQDAHINMPFQSWELRPRATNHAKLTIIAAIVEVEIEIKEGLCCLCQMENTPEVDHLREKWLKPADFIQAMKKTGLNLFPEMDSSKYVSVQNKNAAAENTLYQQMALTASSMAYSWSKWNNEVKEDQKILVQFAEQLEDEALLEESWQMLLVTKKSATKLKMTEFDEVFSEEQVDGINFHSNLYHLVQESASEKAMERIRESDFKFINAVCQILTATKIVTYS